MQAPLPISVAKLPILEAELATLASDNSDNEDLSELLGGTGSARQKELDDAISDARTAAEVGVRAAQLSFYEAFENNDAAAMD